MKTTLFCWLLLAAVLLGGCASKEYAAVPTLARRVADNNPLVKDLPPFNRLVITEIARYPTNGTHAYWWPKKGEKQYDGVTQDVYFQGMKALSGEPRQRTYCCGLTLEVFLNAWNRRIARTPADAQKLKADDWKTFQRLWFVEDLNGPGPSAALERFRLGRQIPFEEAQPGDFVQIWRNKVPNPSGHSVVFLNWVKNGQGEITGLHYWSTQESNGIAENTEFFPKEGEPAAKPWRMVRDYVYVARVD